MKMKEIAARAGVSPATVSLVMNDRPGVNAKTRERITKLLAEHGYIVRQSAESRAKNLLLIRFRGTGHLFETSADFYETIFDGIDFEAKRLGYSITVVSLELATLKDYILHQIPEGIDGILFFAAEFDPEQIAELLPAPVPIVVVDALAKRFPVSSVVIEERRGVHQALSHLYELGHRRIGYLRADEMTGTLPERDAVFWRMSKEIPFELRKEDIVPLPIFVDQAARAFKKYLERQKDLPTAFFADNDILAAGAMHAMEEAGIRVPDDVSLVGYDDSLICKFLHVPLSTCRVPKQRMGILAVRRLKQIFDGELDPLVFSVIPELIVRESTAKPRA